MIKNYVTITYTSVQTRSVLIETEKPLSLDEAREKLKNLQDDETWEAADASTDSEVDDWKDILSDDLQAALEKKEYEVHEVFN